MHRVYIKDTQAMKYLGACLAKRIQPATSLWLQGTLGAGKTTLCQGLMGGLKYKGAVKSPTFSLVNSYTVGDLTVHHFDFYRLSDPYEFDLIGGRDYFSDDAFCVIEWPERAAVTLPPPTLSIHLTIDGLARQAELNSRAKYPIEKIIADFES